MLRLDVWLVENGYFSSRQIAKRAIRAGLVLVDGRPAKPSTHVSMTSDVFVMDDARDLPYGYHKFSQIVSCFDFALVKSGDLVLDVGCSAGGFLSFLLEHGARVIGIDVTTEFMALLEQLIETYSNLSILIDDAFLVDPLLLADGAALDLLIIDVTTTPEGTLTLLQRFTPLLKPGGMAIIALKTSPTNDLLAEMIDRSCEFGYALLKKIVLDSRRHEVHLVLQRTENGGADEI